MTHMAACQLRLLPSMITVIGSAANSYASRETRGQWRLTRSEDDCEGLKGTADARLNLQHGRGEKQDGELVDVASERVELIGDRDCVAWVCQSAEGLPYHSVLLGALLARSWPRMNEDYVKWPMKQT